MIIADKIAALRKKNGWSQEELAEKMKVSRQAVSKWEGAQTVPDLERILQLSQLFGVTTDYLLKDDMELEEYSTEEDSATLRRVSLAQANAYLEWQETAASRTAAGVFLCVLAAIPLILLGGLSELGALGITENLAASLGLIILLTMVAIAVGIFISTSLRNKPYEFLDTEDFDTEYGVDGMVRERQREYRGRYERSMIIGVCLCVLAPCVLFACMVSEMEFVYILGVCGLLLIVGFGLLFLIPAGMRWAGMEKLLKAGEYTALEKQKSKTKGQIAQVYWLTATAIYLAVSFLTDNWERSWIVWPVAGVLFAAVIAVSNLVISRRMDKE